MAFALRVHPVRRYRKVHYPSCWRPWGGPGKRARHGAALLALPAALGAGCGGDGVDGDLRVSRTVHLTRAEGLAVLERAVAESDWSRTDACPTVPDRFQRDVLFQWTPQPEEPATPVTVMLDFLAPEDDIAASTGCTGGSFPAVGFAFLPPWDDGRPELTDPASLSADEKTALDDLLSRGQAAIGIFDTYQFSYRDPTDTSWLPDPGAYQTKTEAEEALETSIREFVNAIRGDGFI